MAQKVRLWLTALLVASLMSTASSASASTWSISTAAARGKSLAAAGPVSPSPSSACATSTTAKVSWTAVSHAASYVVYQATSSSGSFTLVAAAVTGTSWTSGTLPSGSTYYWKVTTKVSTNWVSGQSTATAGRAISSSTCS